VALDLPGECRQFSYPSMSAGVAANAAALARFLSDICAGKQDRPDTLHLVGHSLGGLVILKMFEDGLYEAEQAGRARGLGLHAELPPGRIVLLGSPVQGSQAAQSLARLPFGRQLLGQSAEGELLSSRARHWEGGRELGIIAGDLAFGLGRVLGTFDEPNDGTVMVEETLIEGASDRRVLRVSHTGMLFSAEVAHQIVSFLRIGRFGT